MNLRSVVWTVSLLVVFSVACSSSGKKTINDSIVQSDGRNGDVTQFLDLTSDVKGGIDAPANDERTPQDIPEEDRLALLDHMLGDLRGREFQIGFHFWCVRRFERRFISLHMTTGWACRGKK